MSNRRGSNAAAKVIACPFFSNGCGANSLAKVSTEKLYCTFDSQRVEECRESLTLREAAHSLFVGNPTSAPADEPVLSCKRPYLGDTRGRVSCSTLTLALASALP